VSFRPRSCFFRKNRRGDNYPDTGGHPLRIAAILIAYPTAGLRGWSIARSIMDKRVQKAVPVINVNKPLKDASGIREWGLVVAANGR
ncbi:hypothetical protein RYA07_13250, partial [Pseudomonas syringae pv. actinidiae]